MSELQHRARRTLYAAVTEYIATGEPVGSRKLSRRYGLDVSAATIRNELADLEEAGFLTQPHTSAGRIPTDKGFRAFVDALVRVKDVQPDDRSALATRLSVLRPGIDNLPREAGRILSSLSGGAAVVQMPQPAAQPIAQLRWLRLRPGQLLAVLVTRSGGVENRVISLSHELDSAALERLHNYLELLVGERTLAELRDVVARAAETERTQLAEEARQVMEATFEADAGTPSVVIEGQNRLLEQPEFTDVSKVRSVLSLLDEREQLLELLDRTMAAGGVQVLIGKETQFEETSGLSLITATYGGAVGGRGSLSVLSPTRVDYQKVVPLVGFAARLLTRIMDDDGGRLPE
jgi:heat-inducible transcriptional repressor